MIAIVAFVLVVFGVLGRSLLADEIRGRLDRLSGWLLRQAANQLGPEQQATYEELWLPDLEFILRDAEGRPITRLVTGIKFAAGLLVSTRRETPQSRRAATRETPNEIRDSARPGLVAAEPVARQADAPHPGIKIIRAEPMQPAVLFSMYSDFRHAPSASSPRLGNTGGAVPTIAISDDGSYGPSPEAMEYTRRMLLQMGAEVRDRVSGGSSVVGHLYSS